MKTALLIFSFTLSLSSFAKCPKEAKPSFTNIGSQIEIAAIAGR